MLEQVTTTDRFDSAQYVKLLCRKRYAVTTCKTQYFANTMLCFILCKTISTIETFSQMF